MTAFVVANGAAFTVAFQVYGDPLIVFLISFSAGLLLSGSRLAAQRAGGMSRPRLSAQPVPATITVADHS